MPELRENPEPSNHPVVRCPCCNGSGEIESASPVPLAPMEFAVWDAVRRSKYGIDAAAIAAKIYADRYDGGPEYAQTCIYLTIRRANRRLKAVGQQIVSSNRNRGSVYRIQYACDPLSERGLEIPACLRRAKP
jgi:hypothetical protein